MRGYVLTRVRRRRSARAHNRIWRLGGGAEQKKRDKEAQARVFTPEATAGNRFRKRGRGWRRGQRRKWNEKERRHHLSDGAAAGFDLRNFFKEMWKKESYS